MWWWIGLAIFVAFGLVYVGCILYPKGEQFGSIQLLNHGLAVGDTITLTPVISPGVEAEATIPPHTVKFPTGIIKFEPLQGPCPTCGQEIQE